MRSTGTSASAGNTHIVFSASGTNGALLPSSGSGWSCAGTGNLERTCTNGAVVRKGGLLPPTTLPSTAGHGDAHQSQQQWRRYSRLSIVTPLVQDPAVDLHRPA